MSSLSQSRYRATPQGSETEDRYEGSLSAKARKRRWWREHRSPKNWDPIVGSVVRLISGEEAGGLWQVVSFGPAGTAVVLQRGDRKIVAVRRQIERS
jgi:hypothetical protein